MAKKRTKKDEEPISVEEAQKMLEEGVEEARDKYNANRRAEAPLAYERALKSLPELASPAKELQWIRNHPAMSRKERARSDKPIVLRTKDIKDAPSISAAQQLQHWANRPEEFYKQMMQSHRKKIDEGEGEEISDADVPAEITRIDEMLSILEGAEHHD